MYKSDCPRCHSWHDEEIKQCNICGTIYCTHCQNGIYCPNCHDSDYHSLDNLGHKGGKCPECGSYKTKYESHQYLRSETIKLVDINNADKKITHIRSGIPFKNTIYLILSLFVIYKYYMYISRNYKDSNIFGGLLSTIPTEGRAFIGFILLIFLILFLAIMWVSLPIEFSYKNYHQTTYRPKKLVDGHYVSDKNADWTPETETITKMVTYENCYCLNCHNEWMG